MTRQIVRVAPLSAGKVFGVIYFVFGFAFAALMMIPSMLAFEGADTALPTGLLLALPIIYGIGGFVSMIVFAALYNAVASRLGGIEIVVADSPGGM